MTPLEQLLRDAYLAGLEKEINSVMRNVERLASEALSAGVFIREKKPKKK